MPSIRLFGEVCGFWRFFRLVVLPVVSLSPDFVFAVDAGGLVFTSVRLSVLPLRFSARVSSLVRSSSSLVHSVMTAARK